jgi:hypothetical protein
MLLIIIRFIAGAGLLTIAGLGFAGRIPWLASSDPSRAHTLPLIALAGAGLIFHLFIDSLISWHAKWPRSKCSRSYEILEIPKYRMENKRQLSSALIVTSGVIIGLAKARSGDTVRLDTILLAAGIIFGFINLSVHGGATDEEVDWKYTRTPPTESEPDTDIASEKTYKWIYVKRFHDGISTFLLNLQFLALILGVAALN